MAVICACLPSLRPLFSLTPPIPIKISKRLSLFNTNTNTNTSTSGRWINSTRVEEVEEEDSRAPLDDFEERNKPLGHDVEVRGGEGVKREMEMGERGWTGEGIRVKTEVVLVSSERLDYRDRLF